MGFILVVAGLLMIVTGAKGTYAQFGQQVASDFTGPGNFTYWIVALGSVGALGYVDSLRAFSRLFMTLIIVAMLLSNRGFFAKLTEALKKGPVAPKMPAGAPNELDQTLSNPALLKQRQGAQGQAPTTEGEAKAFGWFNSAAKFFGFSVPATQ